MNMTYKIFQLCSPSHFIFYFYLLYMPSITLSFFINTFVFIFNQRYMIIGVINFYILKRKTFFKCILNEFVKNNALYIKSIKFLIIFLLNDEFGVSPMTHQFCSYSYGMTPFSLINTPNLTLCFMSGTMW